MDRLVADASDRVPKFVVPVVSALLADGRAAGLAAVTMAAWIRLVQVRKESGTLLPDPLQDQLAHLASSAEGAVAFLSQTELFGGIEHVLSGNDDD